MTGEEILDLGPHLRPTSQDAFRPRQSAKHERAVPLGQHPTVQEHHHADVGPGADQAPEALLEFEGGQGEQVVEESILALLGQAFQPCRRDRLRRHLER